MYVWPRVLITQVLGHGHLHEQSFLSFQYNGVSFLKYFSFSFFVTR